MVLLSARSGRRGSAWAAEAQRAVHDSRQGLAELVVGEVVEFGHGVADTACELKRGALGRARARPVDDLLEPGSPGGALGHEGDVAGEGGVVIEDGLGASLLNGEFDHAVDDVSYAGRVRLLPFGPVE